MAKTFVFLKPNTTEVLLGSAATPLPEGFVLIGSFDHTEEEDSIGFSLGHTLYSHIKEILYKTKPDGTPGFWPDTITGLKYVTIRFHEPDPIDPGEGGVDP